MSFSGKPTVFLQTPVVNDGFYPDFTLADLQEDYRIPAEYETRTVTVHFVLAMAEVNEDLKDKKAQWLAEGYADLSAVVSPIINGVSVLVIHYRRAVLAKAKFLLLQQYFSMYNREAAEHIGKSPTDWLTESNSALRAITGQRSRIAVDSL